MNRHAAPADRPTPRSRSSQGGRHAAPPMAVAATSPKRRMTPAKWLRSYSWRHAVGIIAILFAVIPVVWVVSAAFDADPTISAGSVIPANPTLDNFHRLFSNPDQPYSKWYINSMIVASITAFFTVLIGAMAAYSFSRFRFRGRKAGMLTLLLVQMFPAFLALVAIYLILNQLTTIVPAIGLNTRPGLILVYLGGALGVNAWLIKGFFDTIPIDLDESAKVDGATHGQIYWGIILPLAAPVLAVVGLLAFVGTVNEYILASAILQTPDNLTLAVGLNGFISSKYQENWGPFCAGALLAAIPVVILFVFLQRYIVDGLTAGSVKG